MMSDQDYINAFNQSRVRVNNFARLAQDKNINLLLMPQPPAEDKDARDKGDMMLIARVEHKVRSINFTSRDDYPFDTVNIDEVYKIENKPDKPLMYVMENTKGTHAAVIYGYTKHLWSTVNVFDSKRSRNLNLFHINKKYVRFCKIDEVF